MRPPAWPRGTTSRSRRARLAIAAATACVLCGASLTTASADDDTPTREQIRSARADEEQAARDVGQIKAELAAAEQRVIDLGVEAGRAAEAYNGAVYRLKQARQDVRERTKAVGQAKRRLDRTTARLSSALASNAARSTQLRSLATLLGENGPRELLEQTSGFSSIDDAFAADLQKYNARKQVYGLLKKRAERAVERRSDLADDAEEAKEAVDAAVADATDAAASIRHRRNDLIAELAKAQGVSEGLVRQRQRDLAEQRRQDAREQAQNEEQEDPPEEDTQPPPDEDTQPPPDTDNDGGGSDNDDGDQTQPAPDTDGGDNNGDDNTPPPDNDGGNNDGGNNGDDNTPPPDNNGGTNNGGTTPPPTKSGVEQAIAFARAQLGEPYVWAGAGPDVWDCSGLTMQAWASAGVSLPHWSVAQYEATTPVSVSSIQRGDLLFWSNGSSSSIYHVALYLGNGMMIHAPRPGRSVEIVSIYYWIMPDLAGRV